MKIRNGFVSNSSSTSFIVAVNKAKICPHCGRGDKSIIDIIQSLEDRDCDTQLRWTDPTAHIQELHNQITVRTQELIDYAERDPNELSKYGNTVRQLAQWAADDLANARQQLDNIMQHVNEGSTVISFEVSYHNQMLDDIVREQIENGTLILIEENG